ncbi:hypothetical protein [Halocella sp. SP3-1]|nr:hypothetical protein [Halocella sp. SP3-1]
MSNEKGEIMVTLNKIKGKLFNLKNVFKKLDESIKRDYRKDDIVLDAAI